MRRVQGIALWSCVVVLVFIAMVQRFWSTDSRPTLTEEKRSMASPAAVPDDTSPPPIDLPEVSTVSASPPASEPTSLIRGENHCIVLQSAEVLPRSNAVSNRVYSGEVLPVVADSEPTGPLTISEHTLSAIEARFDAESLSEFIASDAGALRLPLNAEEQVLVQVDEVIARGEQTHTLVGKVAGDSAGDVLLVFHDGAISGNISFYETNTHYEYAMAGNGNIAIRKLDPASYTAGCANPEDDSLPDGTVYRHAEQSVLSDLASLRSEIMQEEASHSCGSDHCSHEAETVEPMAEAPDGATVMDTVIGYGKEARMAQGGVAAIEAHIIAAVDRMNLAFRNSRINRPFVALLGMIEDPDYRFSSSPAGMGDELYALNRHGDGKLDAVSQLRIDLGADHNGFIMKQASGGTAGIAFRPGKSMIVARTYMSNTRHTFLHEFGHNIGCNHSWGDTGGDTGTAHHRYGWRFRTQGGSGSKVRTIMAYDWGWTSIPHFSNPAVSYNGSKTGAPDGYDARADKAADPRFVSGGMIGKAGRGFDGSNPQLGANNADQIETNARYIEDNARRKALAILNPNTGDRWKSGETHAIHWHGGDHTDRVTLSLFKGGSFHRLLVRDRMASERLWSWTLPADLSGGSDYSIRIELNGAKHADSARFSIGNSTPPFELTLNQPVGGTATLSSTSESLRLEVTTTQLSAPVTYQWNKISGPGPVRFSAPSAEDSSATFSAAGTYQLQLKAVSGGITRTVSVQVVVEEPPVVQNNPVLHYQFEEIGGTYITDHSGNNNHAQLIGPAESVSGVSGRALQLNDGAYVDSQSGITVSDEAGFSAMAWVRRDPESEGMSAILRQNGRRGRSWIYVASDGTLFSYVGRGKTGGEHKLPSGEWHHVAITAGNGVVRLYLDGQEIGQSNLAVEPASGKIRIGRKANRRRPRQFLGAIDDVRVYPKALPPQELRELIAQSRTPDDDDNNTRQRAAQAWRLDYFGTALNFDLAADESDFDGDGLNNLTERAFGTDPTDPDSTAQLELGQMKIGPQTFLTLSYPRLVGGIQPRLNLYEVPGIQYRIEQTADLLGEWSEARLLELPAELQADGIERANFRLEAPIGDLPCGFFRLEVIPHE